jgi:hypothetical protein
MDLKRRVEELERTIGENNIRLVMPDGSVRLVQAARLLEMGAEAARGAALPADTQAVLDSVADDCLESGNGRMIEAIKAVAAGADLAGLSVAELARLDASEGERTGKETIQ